MFDKIKTRLFHRNVDITSILNKLNLHELELGDSVKIEGIILPFFSVNCQKHLLVVRSMQFILMI